MVRTKYASPAGAASAPRGLWLALALHALCLSSAAGANKTCLTDGDEARQRGAVARSAHVALAWGSQPARAAAAVLRAALLSAGYSSSDITLEQHDESARLCDLLSKDISRKNESVVSVAVRSESHCGWTGHQLEVLGTSAVPVQPRLHARLAPPFQNRSECRGIRLNDLQDEYTLHECGFLYAAGTINENEMNVTVYIPKDEWQNDTEELHTQLAGTYVHFVPSARARLAEHVVDSNRSFLIFDAELWHESSVVAMPLPEKTHANVSLFVADKTALLKYAPALYGLLNDAKFMPTIDELHAVLKHRDYPNVEDAACENSNYTQWRNELMKPSKRLALVVICDTEKYEDYDYAASTILPYHFNLTTNLPVLKAMVWVDVDRVNCNRPYALSDLLTKRQNDGRGWRTVGVVAPAEQAAMAVEKAGDFRLPLFTYTPAPATGHATVMRSATGGPERLANALRRLLAPYGWKRIGIISDGTPFASAVSGALAAHPELIMHEESAERPKVAVGALRKLDTRVFFVNCEADTAKRVLAEAASLASDARVWIVRDYETTDNATVALRPLSVSFQWRGGEELRRHWDDTEIGERRGRGIYLRRLDREWQNRTWPRHVASILDALIVMGNGFEQLVTDYPKVLDDTQMEKKCSYFWNGLQNRKFPGLFKNMQYNEQGLVAATVYVEQWGPDVRPRRLATWDEVEIKSSDARLVDSLLRDDGSSRCLAQSGDPYQPQCHDAEWIAGSVALAAALVALWLAAVAMRLWLERRDRRLERATIAKILAQREAAFADLAEHLVHRSELVLGEELGAGRFGRVRRGEVRVRKCSSRHRPLTVAVKTLREGASPAEESQFLREARLLAVLDHDHVVRFRGVSWEGGPPLLLMELALFGDLLRYLRARRHLAEGAGSAEDAEGEAADGPEEAAAVSAEALTRLAREAAEALAYLGARGFVHRDVRAANCLVDARRSLKLADFGLARETGAVDGEYACRGRALFPVLWMAPESLARGVATAASDAWSFGVLALELVTLGARPFGGASPEAAVRAVLAGGRPPLPRDACAETRALALACWRRAPAERPSAARLAAWLARRTAALRPALAPDLEEPDCDSGIGEPDAHTDPDATVTPCHPHQPLTDAQFRSLR